MKKNYDKKPLDSRMTKMYNMLSDYGGFLVVT